MLLDDIRKLLSISTSFDEKALEIQSFYIWPETYTL